MNTEKAIDLLDNLIGMIEDNQENDYDTAFHMAIDALKAQAERTEERTETHACDLISRKAAIDAVEDVDWYHINSNGQLVHGANSKEDEPLYKAEDMYKVLNDIPSAQPEIVRCKDCEYGEQDEVGRWFCRSLGCQIGNEDGSGYCADAERRTDARLNQQTGGD